MLLYSLCSSHQHRNKHSMTSFFQKHEASSQQLTHRKLNLRVNMSQRDLAYCSVCQQTVKNQQHKSVWLFVTSGEICHCPSVKPVTSNKLWLPDKACVCKRAPIVEGQSTMAWVPGFLLPRGSAGSGMLCVGALGKPDKLTRWPGVHLHSLQTAAPPALHLSGIAGSCCNKSSCFYELECTLAFKVSVWFINGTYDAV